MPRLCENLTNESQSDISITNESQSDINITNNNDNLFKTIINTFVQKYSEHCIFSTQYFFELYLAYESVYNDMSNKTVIKHYDSDDFYDLLINMNLIQCIDRHTKTFKILF